MLMHVVRVVQEAITNAVKHSGADRIVVAAAAAVNDVTIKVHDNGRQAQTAPNKGRGLANMHHRAQALGGRLEAECGAEGTLITLSFPYAALVTKGRVNPASKTDRGATT